MSRVPRKNMETSYFHVMIQGIYTEKHLYQCISYIYHNPVKAKICKNPEEYVYSNIREYKGKLEQQYDYAFLEIENNEEYKQIIDNF